MTSFELRDVDCNHTRTLLTNIIIICQCCVFFFVLAIVKQTVA